MSEEKKEKLWSSRDIYLATTLLTLKFAILQIDYQMEQPMHGRGQAKTVGYFQFANTEGLRDAEKLYRQGDLAVEPKLFITNLRALKAEITNYYKSPHSN